MTSKPNGDTESAPNDAHSQITASIEADLAQLNDLLAKETLDDTSEASLEELLARLESADGMAKGMENKLDTLLGDLDDLLSTLEDKVAGSDGVKDGESTQIPASEPTTTDRKEA